MTAKSFKQMIADKEIKRADAMKAILEDLHEEPGFNERTEGEDLEASISELAEFIASGGQIPSLEVRPRAEGGLWVVDGHRRRRALKKLDIEGRLPRDPKDGEAWVSIVPFTGNDADRVARIVTSNTNKQLSPLEISRVYKRLIAFGWTVDQVAKAVRKTRQHVDQMLTLSSANSDVLKMVEAGTVAPATAVEMVRKHGEGAGAVLTEELGKAKAQGKAKVTAGTMKGATVPRNLLDDMHGIATNMHKSFKPDDLLAIERYHRGEITEGTVEISLEAAMQFHLMLEESARVISEKEAKLREKADKAKQMELSE